MTLLPRAIALLLIILLFVSWGPELAAQTETPAEMMMRDKPPVVPASPETAAGVEELSLPTYYLEDENGQLVPVLKRLKYEEWEQIYKAKLELTNPDIPPRYTLESFKLSGEVVEQAVDITLDLELQVMARGWVRVPLRMSQAVLRKPLQCATGEECFLAYEADGYVLWLRVVDPDEIESPPADPPTNDATTEETDTEAEASADTVDEKPIRRSSYRLEMTVPLTTTANEHTFSLDLPRKAVSSQLNLLIDDKVNLVPPPMIRLTREPAGKGMSRVIMPGVGGEFRLRWTDPNLTVAVKELDVHSLTLAELSGPRSIQCTVRLRVRSLNGPLREFSLRLPPGMSLLPQPASEAYRIVAADNEETSSANERKLVTIELTKPTSEAFELTLTAAAMRTAQQQYTQFEITGFEVPEAKLQSGHIALSVDGDWYLHWTAENNNLREVDVLPEKMEVELAAWKPKNVIARLHCVNFPTNLRLRVTPQRSLIQVEPSYQVFVSDNQLALEATLNYRVRGRKLELLEVDLGDWKLPTFGPESLVRQEAVINENGVHSIPLQQATSGDFTVKFRTTQPLDPSRGNFSFKLPKMVSRQPEREQLTVTPAILALIADDDVAVTPKVDQLENLSPEVAAGLENIPQREQPPRVYRQRVENNRESVFAGHLQVMPQTVAVASLAEVVPHDEYSQVDVRLQYTVKHKPLEWLVLEVPATLVTPESIDAEFQLDGEPIIPTILPLEEGQNPTALLTLPEARRGAFELHVSYRWNMPAVQSASEENRIVQLVQPARDGNYATSSSRLLLAEQALFRLADSSAWKRVAEGELQSPASVPSLQFRSDLLLDQVALERTYLEQESQRHTSVKLAWYQTWLTSTRRRDRAVFRAESTQENVELQLPQGGEMEELEVVVNGQLVNSLQVVPEQNILIVTLPPPAEGNAASHEYVIELMYETALRHSSHLWQGGLARFRFPQLHGTDPERVYWQLVLPSNEYLWFEPDGVTSESKLTMPTWLTPARPTLTQQELEQYSRAMPTPPPAAGANVYLFSGFGQVEQLQTGIVQRRAVVLLGAGLVLALVLPMIYLPFLPGWKTLLLAGSFLLLLGLWFPYLAQLLGTSVVAGCLLVLFARFLQITLSRRRQAPRFLPPLDNTLGQATHAAYTLESEGQSGGSSHGTTATAPAIYSPTFGKPEASS